MSDPESKRGSGRTEIEALRAAIDENRKLLIGLRQTLGTVDHASKKPRSAVRDATIRPNSRPGESSGNS
jgi:hypothetical protein